MIIKIEFICASCDCVHTHECSDFCVECDNESFMKVIAKQRGAITPMDITTEFTATRILNVAPIEGDEGGVRNEKI